MTIKALVPLDIAQAARMIDLAYQCDKSFRTAAIKSVESALRETTIVWEEWEYEEAAEKIADRIFGDG